MKNPIWRYLLNTKQTKEQKYLLSQMLSAKQILKESEYVAHIDQME